MNHQTWGYTLCHQKWQAARTSLEHGGFGRKNDLDLHLSISLYILSYIIYIPIYASLYIYIYILYIYLYLYLYLSIYLYIYISRMFHFPLKNILSIFAEETHHCFLKSSEKFPKVPGPGAQVQIPGHTARIVWGPPAELQWSGLTKP